MYGTRNGILSLAANIEGVSVTAHSKSLEVNLDYDQALFDLKLPLRSIHTGIDSLDIRFARASEEFIQLNGELGIDRINTENHPPIHFEFRAKLHYKNKEFEIDGTGHLEHIKEGKEFVCLLGLKFELETKIIDAKINVDTIGVQLRQTILKRIP
ncbi:MAG: hypothetical protein JXQ96_20100 [Cyclobacteriaceae bacterium]